MTCFPDITVHERTPQDEVLLLACDGLWDVMTSEEAVNTIRDIFNDGGGNTVLVAEEMLELALHKGSYFSSDSNLFLSFFHFLATKLRINLLRP